MPLQHKAPVLKMKSKTSAAMWTMLSGIPFALGLLGRDTLGVALGLSLIAYVLADSMIQRVGEMLKLAGRCGKDLNKPSQPVLYRIINFSIYLSI